MQPIELLAPAKDLESGMAAINYGADAVYIGANKFGARAAAGNSIQDIEALTKYTHKYDAKTFVTLNTILFDNELEQAQQLIRQIYEAGADALIIQDMGILEMDLPPIPLHASTQTHNYDLERIKFLDKVGFDRLILARELSLDQIQEIKANTKTELEYFVHGALCVSFSGQCYFSQAITGRSANRGECAQMCRHPYDLVDANNDVILKNKHLLSLKDLNNSDYIQEIIDAGITSLKIEGRLKDINYVKNIISHYRQRLDAILEKDNQYKRASIGKTNISFTPDPERSFNRGFTNYFLNGRKDKMVNLVTPKSMGKRLGEAIKVNNNYFTIKSDLPLNNGDGLCFVKNRELKGVKVNRVEGDKVFVNDTNELFKGAEIYRNYDHEFNKQLKNDNSVRKIEVELYLEESEHGLLLTAIDRDDFEMSEEYVIEKEVAKNVELAEKNIVTQLSKSGDSIFTVTAVRNYCKQAYFIPAGILNSMRRMILGLLEKEKVIFYEHKIVELPVKNVEYHEPKVDYKANISNKLADQFYRYHGVSNIEEAFELQKNHKDQILMTTRYCIKYELGHCPKEKNHTNNLNEPLYLVDKNRKYRLQFDCQKCLMNVVFEGK